MNIEFEVTEYKRQAATAFLDEIRSGIIEAEFHRIAKKHQEKAIEEMKELLSSFLVRVSTDHLRGVDIVKITIPEASK